MAESILSRMAGAASVKTGWQAPRLTRLGAKTARDGGDKCPAHPWWIRCQQGPDGGVTLYTFDNVDPS